jgi:glycosyltransferase involved in cell wall biosynthesis
LGTQVKRAAKRAQENSWTGDITAESALSSTVLGPLIWLHYQMLRTNKPPMSLEISAVICTHNQAGYLRKSLNSLVHQSFPPGKFEIVVVDNGSIDHTKEIFDEFRHFKNIRYIYEPIIGLSQARNTGWQNSRGKYVAYLDDDAIADRFWLIRITNRFRTLTPKPACVGGRIAPIWETKRPKWLTSELETYVGIINWTDRLIFLGDDGFYLPGSNISYTRTVLKESGGFKTSLGRKGKTLLSNEEILMQHYLKACNLPICYDPEICVYHHIKPLCLKEQWFYDRFYWQGVSDAILEYHIAEQEKKAGQFTYRVIRDIFWFVFYYAKYLQTMYTKSDDRRFLARCWALQWKGRLSANFRMPFEDF